MVIPASTVRRLGPWNVAPSVLKCEEIGTIPKAWLSERPLGGPLSEARLFDRAAPLTGSAPARIV